MKGRIEGFDLARGLAIFGMVLVNFKFVMGLEGTEDGPLAAFAGTFDGRAAATFVILAGIGVSLLSAKARREGDPKALWECRKTLLKRAAFLGVLGVLDNVLWVGDILHFYAVYLAVAACLLDASDRALLGTALGSAAAFAALFVVLDYEKGWDWEAMAYLGQWAPAGLLRHLFFNGFHPVFPWIAFFLVGLVLGRRAWDERFALRLTAGGLAATLAAEALSAALAGWAADGTPDGDWCALLFGTQSMPPTPLYLVSGGGSALALIGACIALRGRRPGAWAAPVENAGRLALSLYILHVVAGMGLLAALDLFEGAGLPLVVASAAVFYAAAVAAAWAWTRRFEHGPLEGLMRRVAA